MTTKSKIALQKTIYTHSLHYCLKMFPYVCHSALLTKINAHPHISGYIKVVNFLINAVIIFTRLTGKSSARNCLNVVQTFVQQRRN